MNNEAVTYLFKTLGQNSDTIMKLAKGFKSQGRAINFLSVIIGLVLADNLITRQKLKVYDSAITEIEKDIREMKKEV